MLLIASYTAAVCIKLGGVPDSVSATFYKLGHKAWFLATMWGTAFLLMPAILDVSGDGTESLYTEISEVHAGTLEDPIPYSGNMELEAGKFYSQGGKVYHCTRDTEIPVYAGLAELVGIYVEEAG